MQSCAHETKQADTRFVNMTIFSLDKPVPVNQVIPLKLFEIYTMYAYKLCKRYVFPEHIDIVYITFSMHR